MYIIIHMIDIYSVNYTKAIFKAIFKANYTQIKMSTPDVLVFIPLLDRLNTRKRISVVKSEKEKIQEIYDICHKLIGILHRIFIIENENFDFEKIKVLIERSQPAVDRLFELTGITEIKFEKYYILRSTKSETENTIITGLKLIKQYLV